MQVPPFLTAIDQFLREMGRSAYRRHYSKYMPHQGEQEIARRRRQRERLETEGNRVERRLSARLRAEAIRVAAIKVRKPRVRKAPVAATAAVA